MDVFPDAVQLQNVDAVVLPRFALKHETDAEAGCNGLLHGLAASELQHLADPHTGFIQRSVYDLLGGRGLLTQNRRLSVQILERNG